MADARMGSIVALAYGLVLVGWIVGELLFMTQTMVLTWVILAAGVVVAVLAAADALPALRERLAWPHGQAGG